MKFLDKFLDTIGLIRKSVTSPSASSAGMMGWLSGGGISKDLLMNSGKNWVYACMRAIAEEVGKIELRLIEIKKDGTEEEMFEHELLDVLYKANNFMTKNELFELLSMHWDLAGNAYWLLEGVAKAGDKPTAFYPLNPKYLKIKKGKWPDLIEKYKYRAPGHSQEYDPFQILHFRLPNPNDLAEGLGTVEAIAEWVDVENFATKWNRLWFWNGARPDLALTTENNLTKDQQEILRVSFESVYKGVENAHKVAIMPKGTDIKDISKSHKDMDFTELDRVYRDKILAGFRVPRTALGITDDVNRANAEVTNYIFALRTIKPRMQRVIDYLNEFLVPRYGENIYLTFKDPVPENREFELEESKAALGGQAWKSVNEIREEDGLPAIDNGDAVSTNFSLVPLGKPIEKKQPKKRIQIKRPGLRKKDEISSQVASQAVKMLTAEIKSAIEKKSFKNEDLKNDDLWNAAWKLFVGRVTPYEKALGEEIKKYNEKQKEKVLAALSGVVKGVKAINPKDLFNVEEEVGAFIKFAAPILFELFGKEGEAALDLIGAEQAFDFTSKKVKEKLNASINLLAENYNQTTLDLLKTKLNEGLEAGEGLDQLKDRVSTIYEFSDEYRAARVAQTETFRTGNAATREAWKQSGVVKTLKWYTAEDEDVCEFCGPMDGKTVGIEEKWFDKGEELAGRDGGKMNIDYVDIENPPLHANCVSEDTIIISPDVEKILRIEYSGELIEISFSDGTLLSVTPHHPILTTHGFIFACNLKNGDKIIKAIFDKGIIFSDPNNNSNPAVISQIFDALNKTPSISASSMPVAAENFHGDGKFGNGNINIISANGILSDYLEPSLPEPIRKAFFNQTYPELKMLSGNSDFATMLIALAASADGIVGGEGIAPILGGGATAHEYAVRLQSSANYNARLAKAASNCAPINFKGISDAQLSLAGAITTNDIIAIKRKSVSHKFVYDLSTLSTLYTANGVITSNCRCYIRPEEISIE